MSPPTNAPARGPDDGTAQARLAIVQAQRALSQALAALGDSPVPGPLAAPARAARQPLAPPARLTHAGYLSLGKPVPAAPAGGGSAAAAGAVAPASAAPGQLVLVEGDAAPPLALADLAQAGKLLQLTLQLRPAAEAAGRSPTDQALARALATFLANHAEASVMAMAQCERPQDTPDDEPPAPPLAPPAPPAPPPPPPPPPPGPG